MGAGEWVWMANPTTGDKIEVLKESFDALYVRKGWTLTDAPEPDPDEFGSPAELAPPVEESAETPAPSWSTDPQDPIDD